MSSKISDAEFEALLKRNPALKIKAEISGSLPERNPQNPVADLMLNSDEDKPSKYCSQKKQVDGITFDSTKEANRYIDLKYLQLAGKISDLKLQVVFRLDIDWTHICNYVADFTYLDEAGNFVVEDCKSSPTKKLRAYRIKLKLMMAIHNIQILET